MTIVPRTGPLSASSALATTSWYQRGKSSAWGVRMRGLRHRARRLVVGRLRPELARPPSGPTDGRVRDVRTRRSSPSAPGVGQSPSTRLRMSSMRSAAWLASAPLSSSRAWRSCSASRRGVRVGARPGPPPRRRAPALGQLDQLVDHVVLGHDLHHLAVDEQVARACGRRRCRGRPSGPRPARSRRSPSPPPGSAASGRRGRPGPALATSMTSISARPQDGQAIRSRPLRSRRPRLSRSSRPALASSTGSAVSE